MAGVTDLPLRRLAWRLGAGLVFGEMTGARPELWATRKSAERREHDPSIRPKAVQIAGAEPSWLADAAVRHAADGAQIIDINMGCPAKKVCNKAAGSALLRDPGLVGEILREVVDAVSVPVTLKIRTGWCPDSRNAVQIAQMAESTGVRALTVHGRTRACRFNGKAEHGTTASVVRAVSIPVFANGDITSPDDALRVLESTGAAGVMIGRAALGAPWLPGDIASAIRSGVASETRDHVGRWGIVAEHLQALHDFYGEQRGLRIARKHIKWYFDKGGVDRSVSQAFTRIDSAGEQRRFLRTLVCEREGHPVIPQRADAA